MRGDNQQSVYAGSYWLRKGDDLPQWCLEKDLSSALVTKYTYTYNTNTLHCSMKQQYNILFLGIHV